MPNLRGWVRLSNLRPGAVFITRDGVLAVKSEYHYAKNNPQPQCILLVSGEYAHFPELEKTWVLEVVVETEFQKGDREAGEDIKAGRVKTFDTAEELFKDLEHPGD